MYSIEAANLTDQRDAICVNNPGDPEMNVLNAGVNRLVNNHKRDK